MVHGMIADHMPFLRHAFQQGRDSAARSAPTTKKSCVQAPGFQFVEKPFGVFPGPSSKVSARSAWSLLHRRVFETAAPHPPVSVTEAAGVLGVMPEDAICCSSCTIFLLGIFQFGCQFLFFSAVRLSACPDSASSCFLKVLHLCFQRGGPLPPASGFPRPGGPLPPPSFCIR